MCVVPERKRPRRSLATSSIPIATIIAIVTIAFIWKKPLSVRHRLFLFGRDSSILSSPSFGESTISSACIHQVEKASQATKTKTGMKNTVKEVEVEAFQRDGSVVLRNIFDPAWVKALRLLLMDAFHNPTTWDIIYSRMVANFYGAQKSVFLHHTSDCGRELLKHFPIHQVIQDLVDDDDIKLRVCEPSEALINFKISKTTTTKAKSNSGNTGWHRDDVYMPIQTKESHSNSSLSSPPIVRLWIPLMEMTSLEHMKFFMLNNSQQAQIDRKHENAEVEQLNFAQDERLIHNPTFQSHILDPNHYSPGDAIVFKGDTPHFAQNIDCSSLGGCSRMILSFCIDDYAEYDLGLKRTPLIPFKYYDSSNKQLQGSGFPQFHPWKDSDWKHPGWSPTYGDVFHSFYDSIIEGSTSFIGFQMQKSLSFANRVFLSFYNNVWVKPILDLDTGYVINEDCLNVAA